MKRVVVLLVVVALGAGGHATFRQPASVELTVVARGSFTCPPNPTSEEISAFTRARHAGTPLPEGWTLTEEFRAD